MSQGRVRSAKSKVRNLDTTVQKLVTREPGDPAPDQWQQRVLIRIGKVRIRSR